MSTLGIATFNLENLNRAGVFLADCLNDAAYDDDRLKQKTGLIGRILDSHSTGERCTAFCLPPGP
jgi:hypothetical protein